MMTTTKDDETTEELTEQRKDDDDEVKDIPRLFEVVQPQREQLHGALRREDGDEKLVYVVEGVRQRLLLAVVLDSHRHHIQYDDDHDASVEALVHHHFEEEQLQLQL